MKKKELTAADVWAMFAETDRKMQETDRQMKETDRKMQETDRQMKETDRKMQETDRLIKESRAETDRSMKELRAEIKKLSKEVSGLSKETGGLSKRADDDLKETRRIIKEISKETGGISRNIGLHAEQYFQTAFKDSLTFGGEKYDKMIPNLKYGKKGINYEFDIVLVNGKNTAIIEAKNRIHPDFVKEFTEKKLLNFKKFFPEFCKRNIYLGIAGFSFDDSVLAEAKEKGIGIIRQVGKTIDISADNLKAY